MTEPLSGIQNRTLALAGVVQAAYLVDRLARTGQCDTAAFNATIHSLFEFDPDTPEAVFGGAHHLQLGLRILREILSGAAGEEYRPSIRYALGALHLQKKLERRKDMQATIHTRLQHAAKKLDHFTSDINDISSSVASIYQDTISHFRYRVQVTGSLQQLQNTNNADRIRALLLAAIRSAVLWRQIGGRRWQLMVHRKAIAQAAQELLNAH
ncbi:MAG: high frequency lysogenization protein HflD [Spongiibacteraceae bacterium]